ncbi:MAG: hypothetical protein KH050_14195 [Clostridiaceae bacterium]|nr:hypothetical protein [Clostridiaceae bacterium]
MFTERKIEKFQQTVSALPDTPNLSAAELKRRFDACPEELRAALNGVCDDGAALEKRMDAYRAETFEGEITRDMLAPAVRGEISGKADAGTNDAAHEVFSAQIAKKCEVYFGTYTGDGKATQFINLGFTPKAVICLLSGSRWVSGNYVNGGIALQNAPAGGTSGYITIVENGFEVTYKKNVDILVNSLNSVFYFIAFH